MLKSGDLVRVIPPPPGAKNDHRMLDAVGIISTLVDRMEHPYRPGVYGWSLKALPPYRYIAERCLKKIDNPGDDEHDERDVLVKETEHA